MSNQLLILATEKTYMNRSAIVRRMSSAAFLSVILALGITTSVSLRGSIQSFSVPEDVALRIRLDDTLTSVDSEVGDPFSATVVDKGDYQNARVYGHVTQIDVSGR